MLSVWFHVLQELDSNSCDNPTSLKSHIADIEEVIYQCTQASSAHLPLREVRQDAESLRKKYLKMVSKSVRNFHMRRNFQPPTCP